MCYGFDNGILCKLRSRRLSLIFDRKLVVQNASEDLWKICPKIKCVLNFNVGSTLGSCRIPTEILLSNGKRITIDVQAGEIVLFTQRACNEIKIDGKDYLVLKESDVIGVIEETGSKKKAA